MAIQTNELKCGGILVGKLVSLGRNKNTNNEYASVKLTLEVGENQKVDIELFANKLTSSGQESKIYKNLMTIKDEYKSLDSQFVDRRTKTDATPVKHEATTVASKEEADFVYANKGVKLSINRYMMDNRMVETFRLTTNFVNRGKVGDSREPFLEGNLQGICENDAERIMDNNGEVVGLKVNFLVPEYRDGYTNRFGEEVAESIAIERFELVLRDADEEAFDYCEGIFVKNTPCCICVEPVVRIEKEEVKKEQPRRGFGKMATFEPATKVVREIRIAGAYDLEEYEYAEEKEFNWDLFQEGVKALDKKIEDLKDGQGKETTVSKGFGRAKKGGSTDVPF